MNGAEPMVPSWIYDLGVLVAMGVPLLVASIWAWFEKRAERRRRRQAEFDRATDVMLGAAMRDAWRRGWIKDGDQ